MRLICWIGKVKLMNVDSGINGCCLISISSDAFTCQHLQIHLHPRFLSFVFILLLEACQTVSLAMGGREHGNSSCTSSTCTDAQAS